MPTSSVVKNQNDGTVTLSASGGSPSLALAVDAGDFAVTGLKKKLQDTVVYQTRGVKHSVRHTARTFPTLSFTGQFMTFSGNEGGGTSNAFEAVLGFGATFGTATSTLGANADVYTLDVSIAIAGSSFGDAGDHVQNFRDTELSIDFSEGDPSTWSCSGTVYGLVDGDLETLIPT